MGARFGIYGLGRVGGNLAGNALAKGLRISLRDDDPDNPDPVDLPGCKEFLAPSDEGFISAIDSPRIVMLTLPPGEAVDQGIVRLLPHLEAGDTLVDASDSWFRDTERRAAAVSGTGIAYVGLGLSGAGEGGGHAPAFMAGGDEEARARLLPLLETLAAMGSDGRPCAVWVGPGGAGHFVKGVHNALEYADMEILAEAYHLLKTSLRSSQEEMRTCFARWDRTELSSHLLGLVVDILGVREDDGVPLIDRVLDRAMQMGTGRRAVESALELGTEAATLAEAVFARNLSVRKDERVAASVLLGDHVARTSGDPAGLVEDVRRSMLAAKIISYSEGFMLLACACTTFGWKLDLEAIARSWRAGAMIRSPFLDRVAEAFALDPGLESLLHAPHLKILLDQSLPSLRRVVARAVESGLSLPLYTAAVSSFDGQRSAWLPANLIMALRDRFGGHGFERVDRPRGEIHHADWGAS